MSGSNKVRMGWERLGGRSEGVKDLRQAAARRVTCDFTPLVEGSRVWQYLVDECGFDGRVLHRAGIGEATVQLRGRAAAAECWVVPIYAPGTKDLVSAKYFALDLEAEVPGEASRNAMRRGDACHLVGQGLIDPQVHKSVVLCGCELSWLACWSAGVPALALPWRPRPDGGDGKECATNRWLDADWDFLESLEEVVLCFGHVEGVAAAEETIFRRLPEGLRRKLARVTDVWPKAVEGTEVYDLFAMDKGHILRLLAAAKEPTPSELAQVRNMRDKIWVKLFGREGETEGFEVHGMGDHLRWRLGEWTLVTGYEGHGKTTWLGHQIVDLAAQYGVRSCVASLEADPAKNFSVMFQQAMGCVRPVKLPSGDPDEAWFDRCVDWMNERVFFYNKVGFVKLSEVLKLFAYTAQRFGCRVFVLDSLMMLQGDLGMGESANEREKEMAQRLKIFCETYDAHLFLVAHPKKVQEEKTQIRKPVRPQDVRGAGEIANLCFNLVSVYMNDVKLFGMRDAHESLRLLEGKGGEFNQADLDKMNALRDDLEALECVHDSTLYCMKQRNAAGDFIKPMRRLWFHPSAKQLWHDPEHEVKVYVQ